ncbi:MAG: TIGR02281 family clan AA aspartic protease [Dissulfurispiraceae bacterium]
MIRRIIITVLFPLVSFLFALIISENVLANEAIPFTERGSLKYITVQINGVPLELIFDTGANSLVLNTAAMQSLGIMEFSASRKLQSHTAGGIVDGYVLTLNSIMLGSIQKYNYDVAYVPSSSENLLGSSFFINYNYYIDEDYKVIRLIPKGSFVFDSPWQPSPPVERQRTGSGRIEVEMDGKKYIYGEGWQDNEEQEQ